MAGATFGKAPKTVNGPFNPSADHKTPAIGSLNLGGMTDLSAVAGTEGVDAKLIHGDRWQQIDGNQTDFITLNQKRTINGNENRMLLGNLDTTIFGTTKDDRFDVYLHNLFAESTYNYLNHRIENHTAPEQEHQPTEHNEVITGEHKEKKETFEAAVHKEEIVGFFAGLTTTKVEVLIAAAEGFGGKIGMGGIEAVGIGWKNKAEALETKLNAFAAKLSGAEVEAGGPDSSIRPIFVGILVAVHIDSPFA